MLLHGGSRLAARLHISPLVIGLTVVSIGTSTPELAVGIEAALQDAGSLAVGNIAGTNTVNILLILGLSALLRPLALHLRTLRFDLPVMTAAAAALLVMAWDGVLSRLDGAVLVGAALIFTAVVIRLTRRESRAHWLAKCEAEGIPAGPIYDVAEALADPHARARGMVQEYEHPQAGRTRALGNPVKLSRSPARLRKGSPVLGEDNETLLGELGYGPADLARLRGKAVI